jgi:hypothetical protein
MVPGAHSRDPARNVSVIFLIVRAEQLAEGWLFISTSTTLMPELRFCTFNLLYEVMRGEVTQKKLLTKAGSADLIFLPAAPR